MADMLISGHRSVWRRQRQNALSCRGTDTQMLENTIGDIPTFIGLNVPRRLAVGHVNLDKVEHTANGEIERREGKWR